MSRPGQNFIPILPAEDKRPKSAFHSAAALWVILRDQLTISSWLCIGALLQGTLILLAGRIALLPAVALLLFRATDAYAMTVGWKRNAYMDDVIMKKHTAQFPDDEGNYGNKPSNSDVTVLMIGTRSNHPLGVFAPEAKELGDYFTSMVKDLEANADEFGFLGATNWLSSGRTTSNEIMMIGYFRTTEGLHAFAHSDLHRKGWEWWNKITKQNQHLSIFHEIYSAPKGHWESIHVNSHLAGINTTSFKIFDQESGTEKWVRPSVDASKGLLKTSAGRMARSSNADEHANIKGDSY